MQSNSQYVWHKAYSWRKRLGEADAGELQATEHSDEVKDPQNKTKQKKMMQKSTMKWCLLNLVVHNTHSVCIKDKPYCYSA